MVSGVSVDKEGFKLRKEEEDIDGEGMEMKIAN